MYGCLFFCIEVSNFKQDFLKIRKLSLSNFSYWTLQFLRVEILFYAKGLENFFRAASALPFDSSFDAD